MFERFRRTTFFFVAIAIIIGIIIEKFVEIDTEIFCPIVMVVALIAIIIAIIHFFLKVVQLRDLSCILFLITIVIISSINASLNRTELLANEGKCEMVGRVVTVTKRDTSGTKFWLDADSVFFENCIYLHRRGVVKLKNTSQKIIPGDYVRFTTKFWQPTVFNGFDYPAYLKNNHLEFAVYPYKCQKDSTKSKGIFFSQTRQMLVDSLATNCISPKNLTLLQALFLGDKTELDQQTRQTFSDCGIGHILAVSGMHVGIIFLIFSLIFRPFMGQSRILDIFLQSLIIVILWIYANITGFAVPIVRATLMTSAFVFTTILRYQTNNYNTLFLALAIILMFEPSSLFTIGLQLSFLAVLGLMAFSRYVSLDNVKFFYKTNNFFKKTIKYICEIAIASTIAQFALLPVTLYYFHYFPTYFFLNNIVVLPVLTLILTFSILTLIGSFCQIPYNFFGFITDKLIDFLNSFTEITSNISYSVVENIPFDEIQCVLLSLLIILLALFINSKNFNAIEAENW